MEGFYFVVIVYDEEIMVCFYVDGSDLIKIEKLMFVGKRGYLVFKWGLILNKGMVIAFIIVVMREEYVDIGVYSWVEVEVEMKFFFDYYNFFSE